LPRSILPSAAIPHILQRSAPGMIPCKYQRRNRPSVVDDLLDTRKSNDSTPLFKVSITGDSVHINKDNEGNKCDTKSALPAMSSPKLTPEPLALTISPSSHPNGALRLAKLNARVYDVILMIVLRSPSVIMFVARVYWTVFLSCVVLSFSSLVMVYRVIYGVSRSLAAIWRRISLRRSRGRRAVAGVDGIRCSVPDSQK